MNDEIRKILDRLEKISYYAGVPKELAYITTNVTPQEIKLLLDYITNLQNENQKLKEKLNCKEYFSSTMPEDTEFVILTKNNYDRQQKDVQLELIDYKSRVEKTVEYFKYQLENLDFYEDTKARMLCAMGITLLQNGSEK